MKTCSDYNKDCTDIENPFMCWLGEDPGISMADGYCPLSRVTEEYYKENKKKEK